MTNDLIPMMDLSADDVESDDAIKDYWSGPGKIVFRVTQNHPDCFEIDDVESTGCAGGLQEMMGSEDAIIHMLEIDVKDLKEGATYTIHDLTVKWIRGDGWITEDDVEYYYSRITKEGEA